MKTSREGVMELAAHEGIVPYPYKDSRGIWTWGIGLTAAAGQGDPAKMAKGVEIPLDRVIEAFRVALARYENEVNRALVRTVSQSQFDALVSFHYNTGAIAKATLTKLINAGNMIGAADAFMNWKKPPEIIPRRKKEQKLFRDGVYSSQGFATVYPADKAGKVLWSKGRKVDLTEIFGKAVQAPADAIKPLPSPSTPATPKKPATAAPKRSIGGALMSLLFIICAGIGQAWNYLKGK